jgi:hypothetical protein
MTAKLFPTSLENACHELTTEPDLTLQHEAVERYYLAVSTPDLRSRRRIFFDVGGTRSLCSVSRHS